MEHISKLNQREKTKKRSAENKGRSFTPAMLEDLENTNPKKCVLLYKEMTKHSVLLQRKVASSTRS